MPQLEAMVFLVKTVKPLHSRASVASRVASNDSGNLALNGHVSLYNRADDDWEMTKPDLFYRYQLKPKRRKTFQL